MPLPYVGPEKCPLEIKMKSIPVVVLILCLIAFLPSATLAELVNPVPLMSGRFEITGMVLGYSGGEAINIDGRILRLNSETRIHNLVNENPIAPIGAGAKVGYLAEQKADGSIWAVEIWVLSAASISNDSK